MLEAIFIALASIALGALIGLWPSPNTSAASPFGTFAIVTAVAVVLGQLLPEALGSIGIVAFVPFVLGYALPRMIERGVSAITKQPTCTHEDAMCTDLGLEVGYIGLLVHRVGDGIGLGLYGGPLHHGHAHYDVILAIAGHTVPVTAVVLLAFKTHRGAASAALRAGGIALATLVGLGTAGSLPETLLLPVEPWVSAAVGGLLLHIVTHGWTYDPQPTWKSRLTDLAAIAAGLAIVGMGGHSHARERGLPDVREAMGEALWELGLETAPMLLLGLAIAALLQTQGDRVPARWLTGRNHTRQAMRGALLGLPLPVCACGILPVAHALKNRGAAPALVVAFLLATPELGIETFALTVRFLGWEFAFLRLVGAFVVAVVAALLLARACPPAPSSGAGDEPAVDKAVSRPWPARVLGHFDELLYHVGAWTLVGLLAAAYVQATLTDGALSSIAGSGLDVLVISALAIPSYVCASSATPLAAVLLAKGVSPGAVLAGLLLGPATNLATLAWLRKSFGPRATALGIVGLLSATWALAAGSNWLLHEPLSAGVQLEAHEHGLASIMSAAVLGLLFLRAVWRNGLQAWLGSLGEALADEATPHAHHHHHHPEGEAAPSR